MIEALVDFLAQAAYPDIDYIGLRIEMIVPDMPQQHRARDHMSGVAHQVFQQSELTRQHLDRLAAPPDAAGQEIEFKVRDPQPGRGRRPGAASQQRLEAGEELAEGEWLDQGGVAA